MCVRQQSLFFGMISKKRLVKSSNLDLDGGARFKVITAQTLEQAEKEGRNQSDLEHLTKAQLQEKLSKLQQKIQADKVLAIVLFLLHLSTIGVLVCSLQDLKLSKKQIDLFLATNREDKRVIPAKEEHQGPQILCLTKLFDERPPERGEEFRALHSFASPLHHALCLIRSISQ